MRILHVVTLVSPDGAYGGPLRVALNLAATSRGRGHNTLIAAATRGWSEPPTELDGVPLRLFPTRSIPGLGLAGIFSPGLLRWLIAHLREFDVVHIHFARDLVTVPAAVLAHRAKRPIVLQTHGMIDSPGNPLAALLDSLVVRRILQGADRIAVLTDQEQADLVEVGGPSLKLTRLGNGVPLAAEPADPGSSREVLFLARLQTRKRPLVFIDMAAAVHAVLPDVTFALVGPDEGEASAVRARIDSLGLGSHIRYEGALAPEHTNDRLRAAALFVLPSIGEVFPMSVLEALAQGVPVVLGGSAGIAPRISEAGAGLVVDDDSDAYTAAVVKLLGDVTARRSAGDHAYELARTDYSMEAAAAAAEQIYDEAQQSRAAVGRPRGGTAG